MKVVIVGGVAGGATAAARIRRLDEQAEIIILERTGHISYANCGLPYYVGGVIQKSEDLTLQSPENFYKRYHVDVRVNSEAVSIDTDSKTVQVRRTKSGETYNESYDKLILSPGASPTVPKFEGVNQGRVFTLRSVEDALKIKQYIKSKKVKSAAIVGGGFIGLEMAENLQELGLKTTIIEFANQLLSPLDYDMASSVHAKVKKHGVKLMLETAVTGFSGGEDDITVLLKDKAPLKVDVVILAIGVTPDTGIAKDAGLELGIKGGILVNDKMETSARDVYAVGDAVTVKHFVTERDALISLAGPANKQGRIAADNVCGGDSRYKGSQGSSIIKVFDLTVATTGINERGAEEANLSYEKIVFSPSNHATYYPGARVMVIKALYEKTSLRVLGAQIIGYDGVDKRIDVIATAIRARMPVTDLKDLDLAYAPPYSSAKDPVNMIGYIAENIEAGKVKHFQFENLNSLSTDAATFLDVRTSEEYERKSIDGFLNIPIDSLRERIGEIDKDKPVYLMCQSGFRSYLACRILAQNGYDCYSLSGGYRFYESVKKESGTACESYPCGKDKD